MKTAGAALLLLICSAVAEGAITAAALGKGDACCPTDESSLRQRKHGHHHLLLFMGGLKSLAALVLIKIKIVLVVAALVAVVVFTVKYLLETTGLFYKAGQFRGPALAAHPPTAYLPAAQHEPLYGYGYHTPIPWDHVSHEGQINEWSKIGDGGRSLDVANLFPNYEETKVQNSFKHRKKRKRNINNINMYSYR